IDSVRKLKVTRPRKSGRSSSSARKALNVPRRLPSENSHAIRTGPASGACCARGAGTQSATASSTAAHSTRRPARSALIALGDIDDLAVRQPVGRAQPLAVARRRLAGHLVGGDLGALLDDDLALALRVRLH